MTDLPQDNSARNPVVTKPEIEARTPESLAGELYVYRDEDRHAVAVSRYRVGPRGGLAADAIARIHVTTANLSRDELDAYALMFAAAPKLLAAAQTVLAGLNERIDRASPDAVPLFAGIADLHAAINKAIVS